MPSASVACGSADEETIMLDQPSALIDIRGVCRSFPKGSGEQLQQVLG